MTVSISMFTSKLQSQPLIHLPPAGLNTNTFFNLRKLQKDKVVIVMGATGTGKSRLSIDIATRFPAEIINSDKMQVYHGLDITTNKLSEQEQCCIPHHLLGIINPFLDFSAFDFCDFATLSIDSITGRHRLPVIAGGSNSYLEALINPNFRSKYDCCFLWVDVSLPVLHSFVSHRVDKMVAAGMVDEAGKFFDPAADYSRGIRKAIGVPEFDLYFRYKSSLDEEDQEKLLEESITKIKDNTCRLASRQLEKILRLRNINGWKIHRLDATEAFVKQEKESEEAWKKVVSAPAAVIVEQFLHQSVAQKVPAGLAALIGAPMKRSAAMAAAAP